MHTATIAIIVSVEAAAATLVGRLSVARVHSILERCDILWQIASRPEVVGRGARGAG
jgi:hypothetical protein